MEAPHEEEVVGVSKGKRTKRVRPQSLIPFTINAQHSSTGDDANADGTAHGDDNENNNNSTSPPPPAATSDENFPDEGVPTEEEEETAKCLILLSQGGHHHDHHHRQTPPNKFFDLFNDDTGLSQTTKFNSKRYVETTNLGNGAKAEFTSGQALGGHMRRHRGGANNNNTNLCLLSPLSIDQESANYILKKPRNGLSLDLNLPAPPEYQNQSRNLQHPPKYPQEQDQEQAQKQQQEQQQTALVLSTTPQLIDCHY
ncbi:hypothetical protein HAX54_026366 [Datura stramonium]|uniref:C2H2-type domain-containing protein n=1 Tax=Datura stramonium TaxID=4076 RepID=A0ABS8RKU0_DATST|nr:hypothetical protein [Datura stramonium]